MTRKPSRFFQFPWRSRKQIVVDVDTELSFHLEMRVEALVAAGVAVDEARRRARAEFGDLEVTRAYCRDVDERTAREERTADRFAEWRQDALYVWRTIRRSPGFAAVSLLTLILAIGANTAIFSVTRAVLLNPLPYGAPGSLVAVYENTQANQSARYPLSPPNFVDFRAAQHTFTDLAAYQTRTVTWRPTTGDPQLLDAVSASAAMFEVLQVHAVLGRTLAPADEAPGAATKAILSYGFWQRAFGGDPAIVGKVITLNDLGYDVIGVMPRGFAIDGTEELWTPLDLSRDLQTPEITRKQHYLRVIGRLRPGVSLAAAEADFRAISNRLSEQYPDANTGRQTALVPLHTAVVGDLRTALLLLQAAAALVLLIGCVNLANVTLSRTITRRRELALRAALGAGRSRLVRQLLTESVLLAVLGGGLGTVVAVGVTRMLLAVNPGTVPAFFSVRLDLAVLLFGLGLSVGTGLLFGLLPALDAGRADLHASLKEGGRSSSGYRGEGLRRGLVVAQLGLAVVLLVGAGLLIRSFAELTRVQLGFDPSHVLTAQVRVSGERYDSIPLVNTFYDRVLDELAQSPGVVAVAALGTLPTSGRLSSTLAVEGEPIDPTHLPDVGYGLIRGDYFKAMGVRLEAGRAFDQRDNPNAPGAVILNRAAVRAFFHGTDPIGRRVRLGPNPTAPWSVVVGVAGDVREERVDIPPAPAVYSSHVQNTWWRSLTIVIRTTGDPRVAEPALRRAVRAADPQLALRDVRSFEEALGSSLAPRRFALGLVSSFAGVALVLAAVGVYGVLTFLVTSRMREFGVRLGLGATGRSVLLLVLRQGLGWSVFGLALGIAGAVAGGRLLSGMLYGVTPADSFTLAAVSATLLVVAGVACLVPAVRATRVDPITIMRAD